jgi:hypothetical protein
VRLLVGSTDKKTPTAVVLLKALQWLSFTRKPLHLLGVVAYALGRPTLGKFQTSPSYSVGEELL